jgi:hypothetical protein
VKQEGEDDDAHALGIRDSVLAIRVSILGVMFFGVEYLASAPSPVPSDAPAHLGDGREEKESRGLCECGVGVAVPAAEAGVKKSLTICRKRPKRDVQPYIPVGAAAGAAAEAVEAVCAVVVGVVATARGV